MGGNVILEADVSLKQLRHVRKYLKAEDGRGGQTKACHGRNGKDLIIKVNEDHTLYSFMTTPTLLIPSCCMIRSTQERVRNTLNSGSEPK
jgi:GTP-binding protein